MNGGRKPLEGLTTALKDRLIQESLQRRLRKAAQVQAERPVASADDATGEADIPQSWYRFDQHPGYQQLRILSDGASRLGINNPYFRAHEEIVGASTVIAGEAYLNYSSYNYLGFAGHPAVSGAAKAAIDRFGTSASASRLVSGERPIHRHLEHALADLHGVDDAVTFVSGHATNVSTIATLFGSKDLVLHDALIHNSVVIGIELSGATRIPFAHKDWRALDRLLAEHRHRHQRVLVVIEGIYSMDGDFPDLPQFIEVKRRHRAFLMVDEAHSLGVLGDGGLGIQEHFGLDGRDVDIWMGTLSKSLASCGGYIAGERALIEHIKFAAPGFVYSVGMPPPMTAAALEALRLLRAEPQRARTLRARGTQFLDQARAAGIDTGLSAGLAIIPAITQSSLKAARLAEALSRRRINVQPIIHPAVAERSARLRFFVSSEHTEEQIRSTVEVLAQEWRRL